MDRAQTPARVHRLIRASTAFYLRNKARYPAQSLWLKVTMAKRLVQRLPMAMASTLFHRRNEPFTLCEQQRGWVAGTYAGENGVGIRFSLWSGNMIWVPWR